MVTINYSSWQSSEIGYIEGACLSTDTKPTDDYIQNGSRLIEMDTGKVFLYDAQGKIWREF